MIIENELATIIVDIAYNIHKEIGPGLLESVYEEIMFYELEKAGVATERQKYFPLVWDELVLPKAFRADLVTENRVIIELKSVETVPAVNYKTLLTYLQLTDIRLGLMINFNVVKIKDGIKRVVNNL